METLIRLATSLGIFFIMICWEYLRPRRTQYISRKQRWPVNLGLAVFNMAVMRLTVGSIAYLSAVAAADNSWGLLHWLAAPEWLSIIVTLLFLDFAIYCQHIISHKWPPLWHFHHACWDRLCKTYIAEPRLPQTTMPIGLEPFRKEDELGFMQLLLLPFKALRRR